ncbi:uncharacterized protein LOC132728409 [Ruditapes philippinarum]|uniref:uncharacterized protein LOC132728409 n=1 Tax=Ruditapes philippinarum TaxID=129788 RepID=UPI00295B4F29|nr:uncharacterized protein LOC132728409 [Ruditapes philippinarum]
MWTSTLSVVFYILIAIVQGTQGDLYCYQCADVSKARDCSVVKKCGPNQVCYSTQRITTDGHIYRKMGCRDVSQCSSTTGIVGKRSWFSGELSEDVNDVALRSLGDTTLCDACCQSNICQPQLCNDEEYLTNRGPICFHCSAQPADSPCTIIQECSKDEVCVESYARSPSGQKLRKTDCFSKSVCEMIYGSNSFHLTNSSCFNCCKDDLCNSRCHRELATTKPPVVRTTQSAQGSTQAGCTDSTPEATCKLAASIVCQDQFRAQNANCEHYCGFC